MPVAGKHARRVLCGAWAALPGGGSAGGGGGGGGGGTAAALTPALLTGGADRTVALTDGATGDTLRSWQLKGEPLELAAPALDGSDGGAGAGGPPGAFSALVSGRRALYLWRPTPAAAAAAAPGGGTVTAAAAAAAVPAAPLELSFQEHYGQPARHVWLGGGLVLVGFKGGRVVVVSSARRALLLAPAY